MPRPVARPKVAGLCEAFGLLVLGLQRVSTVVDGEMIQSILCVFGSCVASVGGLGGCWGSSHPTHSSPSPYSASAATDPPCQTENDPRKSQESQNSCDFGVEPEGGLVLRGEDALAHRVRAREGERHE